MRVGLDGTALLGPRTGVGRYVAGLLDALPRVAPAVDEVLVAFTWRGAGAMAGRRVPARALRAAWSHLQWPPVELLAGRMDLFHGTNFVQPPARRAAGVVTIHDLAYLRASDTVTPASSRYRALVPRSIARAAVVCTPSAAVAAEVAETYHLAPERLVVTPLGVADAYRRAQPAGPALRTRLGLPERYVLFLGSREPRKNLPVLVDAYRRLRAGRSDVPPLCLVGPAGWGPALDLSGLAPGAVVTPGYVSEADLPAVVAAAAVLAFPSRYEGFGLPVLEALACGVPVVAADIAAVREVVADTATLVPPGDPAALANALGEVLDDDGGPAASGRRRSRAAAYTWDTCARATVTAYQRALAA